MKDREKEMEKGVKGGEEEGGVGMKKGKRRRGRWRREIIIKR